MVGVDDETLLEGRGLSMSLLEDDRFTIGIEVEAGKRSKN
jgi:hypothetical protein